MFFLVCAKIVRCLPLILQESGINLDKCEILDYKEFRDCRKVRSVLARLVLLNGRSNFDWKSL